MGIGFSELVIASSENWGSNSQERRTRMIYHKEIFNQLDKSNNKKLSINEMKQLSQFLYNKKDMEYQKQLEKITVDYQCFKEKNANTFIRTYLDGQMEIDFDEFNKFADTLSFNELSKILHIIKSV